MNRERPDNWPRPNPNPRALIEGRAALIVVDIQASSFAGAEDDKNRKVADGILADVAPTLLDILGVKTPKEMTGKSLLK